MKATHPRPQAAGLLAGLLAASLFHGPASAADPARPAAAASQPAAAAAAATPMRDMRASKLIGSNVRNAQNENLGEIKDLIIDVRNERVYYAVLSFGGFLGLGDKLFAIPVRALRPAGDEDRLILNIDKERLKGAPGFDSKKFPDFDTPKYRNEVDGYFGPDASVKPMPGQLLRRAGDWLDKDVRDRNGREVGEVEDLVVDMGDGRIRYLLVEFEKAWSLKDKLFAVAMKDLRYTTKSKDLVWDIDKSQLGARPAFDKNNWPDLNDSKTKADIDRGLAVGVPPAGGAASGGAKKDR